MLMLTTTVLGCALCYLGGGRQYKLVAVQSLGEADKAKELDAALQAERAARQAAEEQLAALAGQTEALTVARAERDTMLATAEAATAATRRLEGELRRTVSERDGLSAAAATAAASHAETEGALAKSGAAKAAQLRELGQLVARQRDQIAGLQFALEAARQRTGSSSGERGAPCPHCGAGGDGGGATVVPAGTESCGSEAGSPLPFDRNDPRLAAVKTWADSTNTALHTAAAESAAASSSTSAGFGGRSVQQEPEQEAPPSPPPPLPSPPPPSLAPAATISNTSSTGGGGRGRWVVWLHHQSPQPSWLSSRLLLRRLATPPHGPLLRVCLMASVLSCPVLSCPVLSCPALCLSCAVRPVPADQVPRTARPGPAPQVIALPGAGWP
eukprot:SAG22_NODE_88_length_21409_cov_11.207180_3_plen_385_part_00